jgi:hypothetical protein
VKEILKDVESQLRHAHRCIANCNEEPQADPKAAFKAIESLAHALDGILLLIKSIHRLIDHLPQKKD